MNCHLPMPIAIRPVPNGIIPPQCEEEYDAPIGRSGSSDAYRNAAIRSLLEVKRKSKPAPEMT